MPVNGTAAGTAAGTEPVAIVGMDVILPGAGSLEDYWRNLVGGVDAITDAPPSRLEPDLYNPDEADQPDRLYCRRGGFVDEFAYFDPVSYGIMPSSVPATEPEQLIALRVAAAAIEDAGGADRLPDRDRVGVILGRLGMSSMAHMRFYLRVRLGDQMRHLLRELLPDVSEDRLDLIRRKIGESLGAHQAESVIGLMPNLTASRIANRLNLRGPSYTIDAACASSLVSVDHGIAELASGRLDMVLAGGVHHNHDAALWSVFTQLSALSRRGEIRPFDASADGLLIGEGTGVVVLKRLSDAVRDGDRIHAVIRGIGTSSDGRSASLVNPETAGQVVAVRRAWAAAGLDPGAPDALGLLEAHGTATPVGDAAELATMAEVFGPPQEGAPPVIGSVKSMIGHTMPAAGVAGLVKAALAVSRGTLLPTLHCDAPRPELARTRFEPIAAARPWDSAGPRRAAVNAFGFGGINAHLILEQPPDAPRPGGRATPPTPAASAAQVQEPDQVVLLAAPDSAALARALDADDQAIRAYGAARAAGRPPGPGPRLGIVDPTGPRLAVARKVVAAGAPWRGGRDVWFSPRPLLSDGAGQRQDQQRDQRQGQIAFVFPGLEAELSHSADDVAAHFGLGSTEVGGEDFSGRFIQVMHLSWLLHDALGRIGVTPDVVAGHSMGEWTAGLVAGLVDESMLGQYAATLFDPAWERQDLMHVVVGAGAEAIAGQLGQYPGVALSHDNAPVQSVVSGPAEQVTRLMADLAQQNMLCQPLPFATGVHTPHLAPLAERLRPLVYQQEARPARITVWSATTAAPLPDDADQRREVFLRQLVEPVRFRATITAMHEAGVRAFLQVGSGQLASLISENLRDRDHLTIPVNVGFRTGLAQLRRVATALWTEGYAPDLSALDPAGVSQKAPSQTAPSQTAPSPAALSPEAAPQEARPAPAAGRKGRALNMRLELGSDWVSLGEGASELLGPGRAGAGGPATGGSAALTRLHQLGGGSAATTELAALLEDTAGAAVAVLSAVENTAAENTAVGPAGAVQPTAGGPVSPPPPPPPPPPAPAPAPGQGGGGAVRRSVLRVRLDDMPYLADHAFFAQPPDWPYMADRMPVVPATTIIQHMIDAVAAAAPGARAVEVSDARFSSWTVADPAQDVDITVRLEAADTFTVTFGGYARATIRTAAAYPAGSPAAWHHDPATEAPSSLSVERMYAERIMFHGPRYRGVVAVHAIGEGHFRGTLRTPAPPGALLDSGLQLLGNWVNVTQVTRKVSFPTGFGSIRFFGPAPAPGDVVECVGRIASIDDRQVTADFQFVADGRVWAHVTGSGNRRFDSHPQSRQAELDPGRQAFAIRQPEGWVAVFDYWPYPESQNSIAALTIGVGEHGGYGEYDRLPIARRKGWLVERLAVKDAVRFLLWDQDASRAIFPIEIRVADDDGGRVRVAEWPGRPVPACAVSSAHARGVGVAMARAAGSPEAPAAGLGIGVAQIPDRPDVTPAEPSGRELAVLEAAVGAGDDRGLWLARFQAARQAAAQAEGAAPGAMTVTEATPAVLTVAGSGRTRQVSHRELSTPDGVPARRYVVAWTPGPE